MEQKLRGKLMNRNKIGESIKNIGRIREKKLGTIEEGKFEKVASLLGITCGHLPSNFQGNNRTSSELSPKANQARTQNGNAQCEKIKIS